MRTAADWKTIELRSTDAGRKHNKKNWWWLAAAFVAIAIMGGAIYLQREWPFKEANVRQELEQATSSQVQFGSFRRTYFPRPGCVAEQVVFRRGSNPKQQQVMTVKKLTIEGNITRLLTKHVALMRAEGTDLVFPPLGLGEPWKPTDSDVIVDELIANGALLEFQSKDEKKPRTKFTLSEFEVHHLAPQEPMRFEVRLRNPNPPGDVSASGSFGPWNKKQVSETPVSGSYEFRDANLGDLAGIRGILASDGKFEGTLDSLEVEGATDTPDFGLKRTPHKVDLKTQFHAEVDSTNGDVKLSQLHARVARTLILSSGTISERKNNEDGKTAALNFAVRDGRIQDLMLLFVSAKQSPLSGSVSLRAKALVPPGNRPFLRKLRMVGDFGVQDASFTKEKTQQDLDKLSTAARGQGDQTENAERVVSDLHGHVTIENGIATFSELSFGVPGARARLNGTYDLVTEKVDLHGMLYMEAKLPQATSGIKSFLLKAIDPFLKKNRHGGAKIPVSITGTYDKPVYKSDPV
jgi:hypothetical protein